MMFWDSIWERNDDGSYWGFAPPSKPSNIYWGWYKVDSEGVAIWLGKNPPKGWRKIRNVKAETRLRIYYN